MMCVRRDGSTQFSRDQANPVTKSGVHPFTPKLEDW